MYSTILATLVSLHSAATPQNVRQANTALLESFKSQPNAQTLALQVYREATQPGRARSYEDELVRHFCLHVLTASLRTTPNLDLRRESLQLLSSLPDNEPRFIEQAFVSLIEQLAALDQDWPDLCPHLLSLIDSASHVAALALQILAALSQNCTNSSFNANLPPHRRAALLRALRTHTAALLERISALLTSSYDAPKRNLACLEALLQWLGWVRLQDFALNHTSGLLLRLLDPRHPHADTCTPAVYAVLAQLFVRKTAEIDAALASSSASSVAAPAASAPVATTATLATTVLTHLAAHPASSPDTKRQAALLVHNVLTNHLPVLLPLALPPALVALTSDPEAFYIILPAWRPLILAKCVPLPVITQLVTYLASFNPSLDPVVDPAIDSALDSALIKTIAQHHPDQAALGLLAALNAGGNGGPSPLLCHVANAMVTNMSKATVDAFAAPSSASAATASGNSPMDSLLAQALSASAPPRTTASSIALVGHLARFICAPPRGPALYLEPALDLLIRTAHSFAPRARDPALQNATRKRAASTVLALCRRLYDDGANHPLMAQTLLPALIKVIASASLQPTERVLLLEAVVVAGKALPDRAAREQLIAQILSAPVQTLRRDAARVFAEHLLALPPPAAPPPPPQLIQDWDRRGFIQDMQSLPAPTLDAFLAMMHVSTLSSEGLLSEEMWAELLPFAALALEHVCRARAQGPPFARTLHPVDAKLMLKERVSEVIVDALNDAARGELGDARCAVVALLSALRTCALEMLGSAFYARAACWERFAVRAFELYMDAQVPQEDRDWAGLLQTVPLPRPAEDRVLTCVAARLATRVTLRMGLPDSIPEEVRLEVNEVARANLKLALCKALAPLAPTSPSSCLCVVSLLADEHAVHKAVDVLATVPPERIPAEALLRVAREACRLCDNEASCRTLTAVLAQVLCLVAFDVQLQELVSNRVRVTLGGPLTGPQQGLQHLLGPGVIALLQQISTCQTEKQARDFVGEFFKDVTPITRRNRMTVDRSSGRAEGPQQDQRGAEGDDHTALGALFAEVD